MQEIGRDGRAYLDRSEQEVELNSVDGRKVCGQPSEQSFKSATGRRCARGTSPESDATSWFGGVRLGGTVDGDVAATAAPPPPASPTRKEEGKGRRNQRSRWPAAVPRGPGPRLGRPVGPSVGGSGVIRPGV